MTLKNKIIIVTGGTGLLGKAIVADIRKKGGIAVNADITGDTDIGNDFIFCDITDDISIQKAIDLVLMHYGKLDGLVNNAYPRTKDWATPFEDMLPDSWRKNVDMQLNSYAIFCQKVIKVMIKQQAGSIVNISSIYGVVGNDPNLYKETNMVPPAAYSAIKGGLVNFTRYLAAFYGKDGIRINCVSPGGIFDNQSKPFIKQYEQRVPLKRMGTPCDIAPAVSFLLSNAAKYITGHNLIVDGGWTAI